jgi:hypothetical protein
VLLFCVHYCSLPEEAAVLNEGTTEHFHLVMKAL